MKQPGTSSTSRRAAANREAILQAACALLDSGGPAAVTLAAVAERADVAVQTIYNRIGGRDAIMLAVAERAMRLNREYMDSAYETSGDARARLTAAAAAYTAFALEHPHEFRLLGDPPADDSLRTEQLDDLVREQNAKLTEILDAGVAEGLWRRDADPVLTADLLFAALDGVLRLAVDGRSTLRERDPAAFLPRLLQIVLHGLAGPRT
ncbi:TetR/AcrR family transcriptional regulator [Mycolicibacterium obuense]|uniref:TetR/AcrR family transcriptional regulator n=1 Tax=Mycolicibacterium obuense TaxID=1807 RepID=A0A4R5X5J8_9MYCO|nr:TetR/AcrR family transcriptional regulator [Mycolicibacterium obuense]TDL07508.1 TetR/AcrR family transcriptional regulator [Mycolicibacterium obuense]